MFNNKSKIQIDPMNEKNNAVPHRIINLLFISGDGMSVQRVGEFLQLNEKEVSDNIENVKSMLQGVGLGLIDSTQKGKERILEIVTGKDQNVSNLLYSKESKEELTPAQLQTLTLIAYLGEASNSDISFIRGVQSSMTLRLLSIRGFITKSGNNYKLSVESLKHLGLHKIEELKEFETINNNLRNKLKDAINVE